MGFPFQVCLILAFMYRLSTFDTTDNIILQIISHCATGIVFYCLYVLYSKNRRRNGLITTGLFKITRHPMYTAILIQDCIFWCRENFSINFWISGIVLVVSILFAGYLQEKETLTHFGKSAREYYAKTPRIFLFYPFRKFFIV